MSPIRHSLFALVALPLLTGALAAQERKIERRDLPAAVEKTVVKESAGANVRGFAKEMEHGQTYYEASLIVGGANRDVLMDTAGVVVEVEQQVALDSLPAAVRSALLAKAGAGKITTVESLTKKDKLVAYEAQVRTGTRRSEVQVGPDGGTLQHEE